MHIMLRKNLLDGFDTRLDRLFIGCSAVLPKQVFQDVRRDNRIALHSLNKVFADYQSTKVFVYFYIECVS